MLDQTGTAHSLVEPVRRVSVIVPHYNDLAGLDLCLADLEKQSYPLHEIIVVDNNSPVGLDAVAAVVRDRAKLVVEMEKGAGPARNGGARAATGEVLAFTDSDCRPEPDWVLHGVEGLAQWDFVGGHIKVLVDDPRRMTPTEAFETIFAFNNERYIKRLGFTGSGNLFCAKTLFDHVGGFRPAVSEDVEWSQRAGAMGYRLGYAPRAVVGHPARRNWEDLVKKWRKTNREAFLLSATRKNGRIRFFLRTLLLPFSILAHAPRVVVSRKLPSVSARIGALYILTRVRMWRLKDAIGLCLTAAQATS